LHAVMGGEEFVLILPNANLEDTELRAKKLRGSVRALNIKHQGKPLGTVTVSVGVATFPQHGSTPTQLMAAADAALYQAKKTGRDRVVIAEHSYSDAATDVNAVGTAKNKY